MSIFWIKIEKWIDMHFKAIFRIMFFWLSLFRVAYLLVTLLPKKRHISTSFLARRMSDRELEVQRTRLTGFTLKDEGGQSRSLSRN